MEEFDEQRYVVVEVKGALTVCRIIPPGEYEKYYREDDRVFEMDGEKLLAIIPIETQKEGERIVQNLRDRIDGIDRVS